MPLFGGEATVDEMNAFLRGNKVVDISKQLVQQGDVAYWSFCVTYLLGVPPKTQSPAEKHEKVDYKKELSEAEFERFTILRKARKQLAEADAVPAFAVFTDAELAEFAKMKELTPKAMQTVPGIGEKRVDKYGKPLCEIMGKL